MRVGLTLLLLLAPLLTGCDVRLPGSTDPLIKIGLVAPFEGQFRIRGYEVLYAVRLAVRQWNEAQGAGRYRVALVALDDGGDPARAMGQARELAVDPAVLGVVGHFSGAATRAAASEYAARGLALVATGAGAEDLTAAGWVVRFGPPNDLLGRVAARYAVEELSAGRVAVLRGEDDLAEAFAAAARRLGAQVVLDATIDGTAGRWAARLADAASDAVFVSSGAVKGAEAIRTARQAGVRAAFLGGPGLGDQALVQIGGEAAEGLVYLAAAPAGIDLAGAESFVAGYRSLAGRAPGPRATLAYEATRLLLGAIDRATGDSTQPPSRAEVWARLAGSRHHGWLGTLDWDAQGEPADWPVAIYRIEAGAYPGRRWR
jgi:branched-chain amino acid transport system substrate-binding protein